MKHTPGPWHVIEGDEWTSDIATNTPEQGIWTVASANKRRDEFEANKRLIAAAPELLAACEKALDEIGDDSPLYPITMQLAAAITKATGR